MHRNGRRVAFAAALLAVLTGAAPALAAPRARAVRTMADVQSAQWSVVVAAGTDPVLAGTPPYVYNSLLAPQYAVLTNFGNVRPGSLELRSTAGLSVIRAVQACETQWARPVLSAATCPKGQREIPVNVRLTSQDMIPGPGETWWLQIVTAVTLGGNLTAVVDKPRTGGVTNG